MQELARRKFQGLNSDRLRPISHAKKEPVESMDANKA